MVGVVVGAMVVAAAMVGCASAYEKAMGELAMAGEERLERRVEELVECAEHAMECLEEAASWYASRGDGAPGSSDGHERVLMSDCRSAVYEFSRRGLSVGDVAPDAGAGMADAVARVQRSIAASERSLGAAVEALDRAGQGAGTGGLAGAVGAARSDVDALVRDARVITKG